MTKSHLCGALVLAVFALACSSSTSSHNIIEPTTPLGFEAVHFDSLHGSACATSATGRCGFLATFAVPPAFGAAASPVTLDSGTGPFAWQGFVLDLADSSAGSHTVTDALTLLAFGDTNVTAGLVLSAHGAERLTDTTTVDVAASSQSNSVVGAVTGACATPPTLPHTIVPDTQSTSCSIQSFNVSLTLGFQSGVTFTMASQNINGVRILKVDP